MKEFLIMIFLFIMGFIIGGLIVINSMENIIDTHLRQLNYCVYDSKQDKMIINPEIKVVNGKDEEYLKDVIYYLKNGKMK
jgi:hypothetical protein